MGSLRTLLSEGLLDKKVSGMALDFSLVQMLLQEIIDHTRSGELEWEIATPFAVLHPTNGSEMVWITQITRDFSVAVTSYNKVALLEGSWKDFTSYERLDLVRRPDQEPFDTRNFLYQEIIDLKEVVLRSSPPHPQVDSQRFFKSLAQNSHFFKIRDIVLKKIEP